MSAQQKFLLAVFYLCAFLALFAPVALAHNHNETYTPTNTTTTVGPSNTTMVGPSNTTTLRPPTGTNTDSDSSAVIQLSSTVALFGALVAAAVFTI